MNNSKTNNNNLVVLPLLRLTTVDVLEPNLWKSLVGCYRYWPGYAFLLHALNYCVFVI